MDPYHLFIQVSFIISCWFNLKILFMFNQVTIKFIIYFFLFYISINIYKEINIYYFVNILFIWNSHYLSCSSQLNIFLIAINILHVTFITYLRRKILTLQKYLYIFMFFYLMKIIMLNFIGCFTVSLTEYIFGLYTFNISLIF